jgi:ubiquinone/menaquinone biosynthesis C-methylase UbiE
MERNDVNPVAAQGFQQAATVYEQARPSYPNELIDFIKTLHDKPNIIIDLGAGTGKLTRLLAPLGAREIIAIEPVAAMRENLKTIPIITKIVDGTAEHIPFEDHSIDMILCAQAFHWFANHRALAEFNRVLKSNGVLVLIWNSDGHSGIGWAASIHEYIDSLNSSCTPRYKTMAWKEAFHDQNYFSELQHKQFSNTHRVTRDLALNRILSTSFVASLSPEQQTKLVDEVRKRLDNAEEIRGVEELDINYVANVYWCSPLKSST